VADNIMETVAELRRLEAEATAGEWDPAECGPDRNIPEIIACDGDEDWVPICYFDTHDSMAPADNLKANRKLIVAMRNNLRALLDYIERKEPKP